MSQLPLDLPVEASYHEEDFLVSPCNQVAWDALHHWDDAKIPAAIIRGEAGCGKTHLAHIWAQRHDAVMREALYLPQERKSAEIFAGAQHLVVENIQHLQASQTLFHLLNFVKVSHPRYRLLLTWDDSLSWDDAFPLPDLRSRLQALPQATIHAPDDALLEAIAVKFFHERQISVSVETIRYLIPRVERSFSGLRQTLTELDTHAFVEKCPINRKLVRRVLTPNLS